MRIASEWIWQRETRDTDEGRPKIMMAALQTNGALCTEAHTTAMRDRKDDMMLDQSTFIEMMALLVDPGPMYQRVDGRCGRADKQKPDDDADDAILGAHNSLLPTSMHTP